MRAIPLAVRPSAVMLPRMIRFALFAASVVVVSGCPSGPPTQNNGPVDARAKLPAPPAAEDGFRVVGPDITIPAGGDQMWCWVTDVVISDDHLVKDLETYQGPNAHHLLALKS